MRNCPPCALHCVQPSNEAELCNAVATAIAIDDQPSCFRFPRGNGIGADFSQNGVAKNHKGTPWEVSAGCLLPDGCRGLTAGECKVLMSAQFCHIDVSGKDFLACIPAWMGDAHEDDVDDGECCVDRQGSGEEGRQGRRVRGLRHHGQQCTRGSRDACEERCHSNCRRHEVRAVIRRQICLGVHKCLCKLAWKIWQCYPVRHSLPDVRDRCCTKDVREAVCLSAGSASPWICGY